MNAIDFANSYLSAFGTSRDDGARIQIDAACTLVNESSATEVTYYLIAPCRTEDMYEDDHIFKMPSADWRGVWAGDERVIHRKYWMTDADYIRSPVRQKQYGPSNGDRLDITHFPNTRVLSSYDEVVEEALGMSPLIGRTELRDDRRGIRALLEYPVMTMNARKSPPRFQVDTGPLIVPDFESTAERDIERFELAYVGYNVFDKAEFMLRRPKEIAAGVRVTDYSTVAIFPAHNEILVAVR